MYKLRLRSANFADALGVYGSQFIPWHVFVVFYLSITLAVYQLYEFTPFDLMRINVMAIIAVVSIFVLTVTGLDRFVPLFGLPSEPDVKLRKNIDVKTS